MALSVVCLPHTAFLRLCFASLFCWATRHCSVGDAHRPGGGCPVLRVEASGLTARRRRSIRLARNFTDLAFVPFLLIVLLLFHLIRNRTLTIWMLICASCLFYAWWNPYYLFLLGFAAVIDFIIAQWISSSESDSERKLLLVISIDLESWPAVYVQIPEFCCGQHQRDIENLTLPHPAAYPRDDIVLPVGISFLCLKL